MAITIVFGVWALLLIELTAVGMTRAQGAGLGFKTALKGLGSTVVVVLALGQAYAMHAVMGHLPRGQMRMGTLLRAHLFGGRTAIVLAALIAVFCLIDIGAPSQPWRVAAHATSSATAFTALVSSSR